jgi:hypothetical protein
VIYDYRGTHASKGKKTGNEREKKETTNWEKVAAS